MAVTWNFLKQFDRRLVSAAIPRTSDSASKYNDHKMRLAAETPKRTLADFIKTEVLKGRDYVIGMNLFPYDCENNLYHLVFWMAEDKKISMDEAAALATQALGAPVIIFENAPEMQSVANLPHYQLFVRGIC